jgi:hypothetical protein
LGRLIPRASQARLRQGASIAGAVAALALGGVACAGAADVHDAVAGHPGVTYLALLRQAIPDLADYPDAKDAEGSLKRVRHLAGKGFTGQPPDPVAITAVEDVRFRSGGRPRIAILANLGPSAGSSLSSTLLAVFDDAPRPRLLDVADVGLDIDTGFDVRPTFALGPGDDALVTHSWHANSNQTFGRRLLAILRGDALQPIGIVDTFEDHACGWVRTEEPTFTARPGAGHALPRIDVAVVEAMEPNDEDCAGAKPPKAYQRTWRGGWRWSATTGAYHPAPGDLDRLDKRNASRF